jgi:hypothetical protein
MGSGKIAKAEVNDLPHLNLDPIGLPRQVNRQKRREILCAREAKSTTFDLMAQMQRHPSPPKVMAGR